jgi:hypothetical protein
MDLSTWLTIHAVIGFALGLVLVCAPKFYGNLMGIKFEGPAVLLARSLGGTILAVALINWMARDHTDSSLVWAVVGGNIILHLVDAIIDVKATMNKVYTKASAGWGSVVFHLILVFVFGYYLLFTR